MRLPLYMIPLLALGACEETGPTTNSGTSVSVEGKSESGGDLQIKADGETGKVALKLPGIEGSISLPKIELTESNFDIDGVKFYPGTKFTSISINEGGDKGGKFKAEFTSPADRKTVLTYLRSAFADRTITLAGDDDNLAGVTKDGNAFAIALLPSEPSTTSGTITLDAK